MKKYNKKLTASATENLYSEWQHPELKENEVLLINVKDDEDWEKNLPDWLVSVRRGEVAYTTGGKEVVKDMKPLFGLLKNIILPTTCGDWFPKVAERAKEITVRFNRTVEFDFNGVKCLVNKNTNLEWLFRDYQNANTMDWKQIGTDCLEAYEPEVQAELDKRNAAYEEQQRLNQLAYRVKEEEQKRLFEEKIKGIEMEFSDKKGWDDWKANNTDGYGSMIFQYAEGWAKVMQKEFANRNIENPDVTCMIAHAENCSRELDFYGITGFMYGAAVSILSKCWKHGEALRKWHNKEFGQENVEGVVNPAIFVINTDKE